MHGTVSFEEDTTAEVMMVSSVTGSFVSIAIVEHGSNGTGGANLFVHSLDEVDVLIAAAAEAKRQLEKIVEDHVQAAWSAVMDYCLDARTSSDVQGRMLDRVEALVRENGDTVEDAVRDVIANPPDGDTAAEEHAACLADARYHADREAV